MAVTMQMLTEAREAYHRLVTGDAVAEFRDQNGELVRYAQANANKLAAYIKSLEDALGLTPVAARAPMRVWF
ncbi:phage tail protein [Gemmobacter lutimaris]|jgi:serine kinase of HPr protein (carbohydrate metabolism regulator)|uniref:Phage tail protein n=1 Tax=Gemmobacter lutimaris TaxID=2306023 RepID=A0A398BQX7_9RHOB|nr:gpW family head-tail joining protein [Gemmobacter lutimaris]RID91897.1 phage tail protein [Gemmobacter lutimaris]